MSHLILLITLVSICVYVHAVLAVVGEVNIHSNEERYPLSSKIETFKSWFTPATISDDMINRWVKEKKSVDKVFVRLNLKTTREDKLVANPHFVTWINYVKALNAKDGPSWLVILKLTEYYGDNAVARIIGAAKKKYGTENVASDLQTQQFQYWLHRYIANTPEYVFGSLRLGIVMDKLLENPSKNPLFMTWLDYVKFYNKHTKKQQEGYLSTLGVKFRYSDAKISKMVDAAKTTPSTMEFAKQLRAEQAARWLSDGIFPVIVWGSLKRDIVGKNILASPEFKTFVKIVDQFNKKNPDKKLSVVSILKDYDGIRGPTRVIIEALTSKEPGTENIVKQVETALFGNWLTKYDPSQVFGILKLRRSPRKLLENPLLSTWGKYVNAFNAKNPDKRTTVLRTQFGDEKLVMMLAHAKTVPSSKDLATKLETLLLTKLAATAS